MFHNLFDSHVHSDNSPDGVHSVMYLAERAEALGFTGIAITDHADCIRFGEEGYLSRIVQSAVDTAKTAAAFRHRMAFSLGVEIGFYRDGTAADRILSSCPFDFVLGSIHCDADGASYYRIDYPESRQEQQAIMDGYFRIMLSMVQWGGFDSLAHITYPVRSALRNSGVRLDLETHREIIDEILRLLVDKGKALEFNASGLRSELGETMPPLWVIRRYRELGGELVTIGSDAHRVEDLGFGVAQCMEALQQAGFGFFAFYRRRKPVMLRIV